MLVVRAYPVLSRLVIEITCVGHALHESGAGHLLLRTEVDGPVQDLGDFLEGLQETLTFAHREWVYGDLESYDDCCL